MITFLDIDGTYTLEPYETVYDPDACHYRAVVSSETNTAVLQYHDPACSSGYVEYEVKNLTLFVAVSLALPRTAAIDVYLTAAPGLVPRVIYNATPVLLGTPMTSPACGVESVGGGYLLADSGTATITVPDPSLCGCHESVDLSLTVGTIRPECWLWFPPDPDSNGAKWRADLATALNGVYALPYGSSVSSGCYHYTGTAFNNHKEVFVASAFDTYGMPVCGGGIANTANTTHYSIEASYDHATGQIGFARVMLWIDPYWRPSGNVQWLVAYVFTFFANYTETAYYIGDTLPDTQLVSGWGGNQVVVAGTGSAVITES